MRVITRHNDLDLRVPIKSWCMQPEATALDQAANLANLPFAVSHVALMPDTHMGYGMPIGGVIALDGVVIPNAVGVDIGCGMLACSLNIRGESVDDAQLRTIMGKIRERIPVGFAQRSTAITHWSPGEVLAFDSVVGARWVAAALQLGTLGGGNHFIEIQKDENDNLWFMIHSGSRNLGKKVADFYNELAMDLNKDYYSSVPAAHQLAFLPERSDEAKHYICEMNACLAFAQLNREVMASLVEAVFFEVVFARVARTINIHHNYAALERHFGRNVWVHRKGATSAKDGELGIIPGSQGTASYIVRGKGARDSFTSCSHGAGRKMGRKEAQRSLNLADEQAKLAAAGVVHSVRNVSDLDEAPGAYKDIETVMMEQEDLVEIVHTLRPIAVIKG